MYKYSYQSYFVLPPGYTIKSLLNFQKMTKTRLAMLIGLPIEQLEQLLSGELPITRVIALKLESIFRIPAKSWMDREVQYRDALVNRERMTKNE